MITQWTITKDCQADQDVPRATNVNAVGIVGPRTATLSSVGIISHDDAVYFRVLDDDGEACYYGYVLGDNLLAPLDDFGRPNAGCTSIEILKDGQWQAV